MGNSLSLSSGYKNGERIKNLLMEHDNSPQAVNDELMKYICYKKQNRLINGRKY